MLLDWTVWGKCQLRYKSTKNENINFAKIRKSQASEVAGDGWGHG